MLRRCVRRGCQPQGWWPDNDLVEFVTMLSQYSFAERFAILSVAFYWCRLYCIGCYVRRALELFMWGHASGTAGASLGSSACRSQDSKPMAWKSHVADCQEVGGNQLFYARPLGLQLRISLKCSWVVLKSARYGKWAWKHVCDSVLVLLKGYRRRCHVSIAENPHCSCISFIMGLVVHMHLQLVHLHQLVAQGLHLPVGAGKVRVVCMQLLMWSSRKPASTNQRQSGDVSATQVFKAFGSLFCMHPSR